MLTVGDKNENICPICGEPAIRMCKCPRADSYCKHGHEWHYCTLHNKIVIGPANHEQPTFGCSCKDKDNG